MRKFKRLEEPEFLKEKWEAWGREWEARHDANPKTQFHWHQVDGEPVNQKLLPLLKLQTQTHCSFCDIFPVSPPSLDTIEHFRPKSTFPRDAYRWGNLYFGCMHCQEKGDEFDEALLQPDAPEYGFDRYFRWDYTTGELKVNELASPENQRRGEVTIDLYRLNKGHPSLRKRELRRRSQAKDDPLDDFCYRHFVETPGDDSANVGS